MSRYTPRAIVLLMAREIDDSDPEVIEDDEYISEWEPAHSCDGGDPTCAACWVESYDAAVSRLAPVPDVEGSRP